jgi:D-3-phosphoglycerate dehydrogenase
MTGDALVAAVGHSFAPLELEAVVLAKRKIGIIDGNTLSPRELGERGVSGILLGTGRQLDRVFLEAVPSLKAIVRYGVGLDNVDLTTATTLGMIVCNVPDYCVEEVGVHVLACALSLSRAIGHWDANIRRGAWRAGPRPRLHRPSQCTLGIIGFGRIGRALAERAKGIFGALLVYDPWYRPIGTPPTGVTFTDTLELLLQRSDIISVHVPLTPETKGMIGAAAFARMKPNAYVVNASRGGIVDEAELLDAVRAGRIAGGALDTFLTEPLPNDHALMAEKRILLSPHIAWLSEEAEIELRERAAEEMARVLTGQAARSQVNAA